MTATQTMTASKGKTMDKQYCLVLMSNPYPRICIAEIGPDGRPLQRRLKKWTGKWDGNGKPIYRGTHLTVETWDVHSSGGTYSAPSVGLVDATPRSYAEAEAIALRCPKSIMDYDLLREGAAEAAVKQAIAELA